MQRNHPRRRRLTAVGLAAIVFVGLAACGDDDEDAAPEPVVETDADTGDTGDTGDDGDSGTIAVEACDAFVDFSAALLGDPAALTPVAEALAAALPDDLSGAGDTLLASIGQGEEAIGSPDFADATNEIGAALYEGCASDEQLDVTGVDYAFQGLPAEVAAGRVAIRFTNGTAAAEAHELVLLRRNEGTTETVEELMALPPDQVTTKLTMAGVVFVEEPGADSTVIADLEPGEYVALCMIPVGGGEEGDPHALHGMVAELTVT